MPAQAPDDPEQITIVLADDHEIVREGIRMVLDAEPDLAVIGEAGDVAEVMRRLRAYHPAVLVLDLSMPGEPALPAIPSMLEESPQTGVLVLTMQNEPAFAREALRAGARGFVVKHAAGQELVEAVRMIAAGGTYMNPQLGARVAAEPPPSQGPPDGLTEREAQVLALIALGYTNPEIAQELYLSVRTVETHRANIQQKLNLSTRADLVRYALDHDLIEREASP